MDFAEKLTARSKIHTGGYTSDPEDEGKRGREDGLDGTRKRRKFITSAHPPPPPPSVYGSMNAHERHHHFIRQYIMYYGNESDNAKYTEPRGKTDMDVIKDEHRFLWTSEDEVDLTWEKQLAKKYYDKLYKEYCIADLSRYKDGQIGLRWRTKMELFDGKGQFICGNKRCTETKGLQSWEVNFSYSEHGERKNALVKVRLCSECSVKLNHKHKRRLAKQARKQRKEVKRILRTKRREREGEEGGESYIERENSDDDDREEKEEEGEGDDTGLTNENEKEDNLWAQRRDKDEEEVREEEFDAYFDGMFL